MAPVQYRSGLALASGQPKGPHHPPPKADGYWSAGHPHHPKRASQDQSCRRWTAASDERVVDSAECAERAAKWPWPSHQWPGAQSHCLSQVLLSFLLPTLFLPDPVSHFLGRTTSPQHHRRRLPFLLPFTRTTPSSAEFQPHEASIVCCFLSPPPSSTPAAHNFLSLFCFASVCAFWC